MNKLITITSDFGDQFASAQLKAVVASLGFDGQIIENHEVTPFSILEGAFEIQTLARYCPKDSVHLGVIDPEVGNGRWGIIIKTRKGWFVGPNNGILYPAAKDEGIRQVWKINEELFENVSPTFHGRDIFIKAAVFLAQDRSPRNFGCIKIGISKIKKFKFKENQVMHVDHYGNVKIFKEKTNGISLAKTFSDVEPGKPIFFKGSSDTLEFALNLGSAAKDFNIKIGDILENL